MTRMSRLRTSAVPVPRWLRAIVTAFIALALFMPGAALGQEVCTSGADEDGGSGVGGHAIGLLVAPPQGGASGREQSSRPVARPLARPRAAWAIFLTS